MKLVGYLKSIKGEFKHVSWPTRKQAMTFTIIVIAISFAVAIYLGFFDFIFSKILEFFIL